MTNLQWLQEWLLENCNMDSSDHDYDISIETLDNPGWHIRIQVQDTKLENEKFEKIAIQREDENNWLHCKVEDKTFESACGPRNLDEVISIFKEWATSKEKNTD